MSDILFVHSPAPQSTLVVGGRRKRRSEEEWVGKEEVLASVARGLPWLSDPCLNPPFPRPCIVYMLNEMDIMEDWTAIKKVRWETHGAARGSSKWPPFPPPPPLSWQSCSSFAGESCRIPSEEEAGRQAACPASPSPRETSLGLCPPSKRAVGPTTAAVSLCTVGCLSHASRQRLGTSGLFFKQVSSSHGLPTWGSVSKSWEEHG